MVPCCKKRKKTTKKLVLKNRGHMKVLNDNKLILNDYAHLAGSNERGFIVYFLDDI